MNQNVLVGQKRDMRSGTNLISNMMKNIIIIITLITMKCSILAQKVILLVIQMELVLIIHYTSVVIIEVQIMKNLPRVHGMVDFLKKRKKKCLNFFLLRKERR